MTTLPFNINITATHVETGEVIKGRTLYITILPYVDRYQACQQYLVRTATNELLTITDIHYTIHIDS